MPLAPNATEQEIVDFIGANYGPDVASFLRVPELKNLLIKAGQQEAAPDLVSTWLRRTDWYRKRSESMRTYDALALADPAQHKRLIDEKAAELAAVMDELGIVGPRAVASQALRFGWGEQEIKDQFAKQLRQRSDQSGLIQGSTPDVTADKLMSLARNEYFVPISRQDAERWAIDIFRGTKTEDGFRDFFGRMAASRFPGIADQGFTPGEYMAPIRNIIAETLEVAPEQVDFLDRRYAPVLEQEGKDGRMRPMSLAEATKWARSQPQYQQTKGALDEAAALAETIGQTFGRV